jgi:hypothetical protein
MPKDLIGRRQRCVEWISRPSPTASPKQSDDDDDENNGLHLLGITATELLLSTDHLEECGVEGEWD